MNAMPTRPAGTGQAAPLDPSLQPLRFLLMRYARAPSASTAGRIADCVDGLLAGGDGRVPLRERCTYRRMRAYWRLVERLG
ncbi:hypothetical protein SAMN02949497_0048 [Methylomagnum ishizawai]|uniref:Uncharacterized protein n=2 Tax=Methylomagnum ishizawai TaxID=1760988 RepID=A0A1Y6DEC0_9GAMM|nr:hypothetical protein SAMN02949497_0048 [Methylomagnum ishizawai]